MIPLAELPTTDGVYVIHFSAPLAHTRGLRWLVCRHRPMLLAKCVAGLR
jgi:hypothetical protein